MDDSRRKEETHPEESMFALESNDEKPPKGEEGTEREGQKGGETIVPPISGPAES